jgi:hypothetical protein
MDSTDEICIRCASQTMFREIPQKRGYAGIPHFVDLVAPHDLYRKLVIQKSKQCISRFACLMIFFVENTSAYFIKKKAVIYRQARKHLADTQRKKKKKNETMHSLQFLCPSSIFGAMYHVFLKIPNKTAHCYDILTCRSM